MLTLQPRHVDSLIAESGLTAPQVTGMLTLLEMRGLAKRVPGNAFVRTI
jgi:predicted Rossmann fold nucleotide-binding protein DprA/Smf involved in DNA uptake